MDISEMDLLMILFEAQIFHVMGFKDVSKTIFIKELIVIFEVVQR